MNLNKGNGFQGVKHRRPLAIITISVKHLKQQRYELPDARKIKINNNYSSFISIIVLQTKHR